MLGAVLLAGLVFYLVNAAHFAHQPLRIEENEWPPMAEAIYDHGRPVIPFDETHKLRFAPDGSVDRNELIGAWHPPLYLYMLAATMPVLGGDASYALRGIGIAGLLVACLLLFLIAREVAPRRWPLIGTAAVTLLLVHPYAIQGSTFIDIDTSIYAPAILLVLWLAIRFGARERIGVREVLLIGAALALVGWMKLTTALILLPVLALWWILLRRVRGIPEVSAMIAAGAAMFFATYALWCQIAGIPFSYTFRYTFQGKSDRLGDSALLDQAFQWHLMWFMPVIALLVLAYGVDAVVAFARTRRPRPLDLLWGFGVAVLIGYVVLSPTNGVYQGKYAFPALPALMLPIAWMLLRDVRAAARPLLTAAAAAGALAVGVIVALLMPDLLTGQRYVLLPAPERLAIVLATVLALRLVWDALPGRATAMPALMLLVAAPLLIAQSVRSYEADVSPMWPVQDKADFVAGQRALNAAVGPGDIVLAAKDIGFYVQDAKVIEGEDAVLRGDELTADVLREQERVRAVASDSFGPPLGPATQKAIADCFGAQQAFGTTVIRTRTEC